MMLHAKFFCILQHKTNHLVITLSYGICPYTFDEGLTLSDFLFFAAFYDLNLRFQFFHHGVWEGYLLLLRTATHIAGLSFLKACVRRRIFITHWQRRNLIFRLGIRFPDINVAPQCGLRQQPLAPGCVVATFRQTCSIQRPPIFDPFNRQALLSYDQRYNLFAKISYDLTPRTSAGLFIEAYGSSWLGSGQIPSREVDAGRLAPFGALDPSEGGLTERQMIRAFLRHDDRIHEIKSTYILQPGPAALTDGVRQLHDIITRTVNCEP